MSAKTKFAVLLGLLFWANFQVRMNGHGRTIAPRLSLAQFPLHLEGWSGRELPALSEGERQVLKADDYLIRMYDQGGIGVAVFVAYYRSQRSGDALHSPKNCLPGSGWTPVISEVVGIPSLGRPRRLFEANHYVVQKGATQLDVLYWYQANKRVYASEYWGKAYLVWDALTKNRTDGTLIRLTAVRSSGSDQALRSTIALAQQLSDVLPEFIQQ